MPERVTGLGTTTSCCPGFDEDERCRSTPNGATPYTEYTHGLIYYLYQSGALNESASDAVRRDGADLLTAWTAQVDMIRR